MKPTEKRRTVWVNDADWATICARAEERGLTPSALFRATFSAVPYPKPLPVEGPWPAVTFDKDLSRDRAALGLTPLERATATVKAGFGTGRPAPKPSKAKK